MPLQNRRSHQEELLGAPVIHSWDEMDHSELGLSTQGTSAAPSDEETLHSGPDESQRGNI